MSLAFFLLTQAAIGIPTGPDLAEVERAVGKCDSGTMTKIFAGEPQRRRAAMIAIFNEQQAVVEARRALAQRRFEAMNRPPAPVQPSQSIPAQPGATPVPAVAAAAPSPNFDMEAQQLADRQQALDDARMLGGMRDNALDMMRQQYLIGCNGSLASAGK
ncbi:hypothetical protein [Sphingobium nicotianae]|uniref:Uncharacterized protein n=1 Tax=Sphingobium nicotianae TaxID=2782607 RepID=A0A9X1IQB7_9SPHN|nr:hypothetical protein [Sphingobium nicotianae]MBT2186420.1 hypothetical protein [Sphingobium nicotianae]